MWPLPCLPLYYYPQYLYLQGANLCTSIFSSHEGDANRVKYLYPNQSNINLLKGNLDRIPRPMEIEHSLFIHQENGT